MLTFRNTTLAFFFLLLLLSVFVIIGFEVYYWYFFVLTGIYFSVIFGVSFFIRSGFYHKALSSGDTDEKKICITFDDGPDIEYTNRILDILKDADVTATFFCIGRKIRGNEELLQRMEREGHLVGTHSYSHSNWFDLFSSSRIKKEFQQCEEMIQAITGKRPLLFRPPYGVINPLVKKALEGTGYHVIGFSNRAWDTVTRKEGKILSRICSSLKPGDIVLLHDTVQQNINVLKGFLEYLSMQDYKVVPLDKLLNISAYE